MKAAAMAAVSLLLGVSSVSAGVVDAGAQMSATNVAALIKGLMKEAAGMAMPPSSAESVVVPTFSGHSRWTTTGGYFEPLEQLGVMKSAEQNAVMKCQSSGNVGCVATGSQITTCNSYSCEADAAARVLPSRQGSSVGAVSRWTSSNGSGFSALKQLGVQKSAEQGAVLKCQQQGLSDCAAIGAQITNCGSYSCEASALAIGY